MDIGKEMRTDFDYVMARLNGATLNDVSQAYQKRQKKGHESLSKLTSQLETLDPFEATEKQAQYLKRCLTRLKKEQRALKQQFSSAEENIQKKTQERNELLQKLQNLQTQFNSTPPSSLEAPIRKIGHDLSVFIAKGAQK